MKKFSLKIPQFSQILAMKLGRAVKFPEAKRTEIRPYIQCVYIVCMYTFKMHI